MITKGKNNLLWDEIEERLDILGVNKFYVPETLLEEDALELFIKVMEKFGPLEVIKRLGGTI